MHVCHCWTLSNVIMISLDNDFPHIPSFVHWRNNEVGGTLSNADSMSISTAIVTSFEKSLYFL